MPLDLQACVLLRDAVGCLKSNKEVKDRKASLELRKFMPIHSFHAKPHISSSRLHYRKGQQISTFSRIQRLGNTNALAKLWASPSNSCWDISVWTMLEQPTYSALKKTCMDQSFDTSGDVWIADAGTLISQESGSDNQWGFQRSGTA